MQHAPFLALILVLEWQHFPLEILILLYLFLKAQEVILTLK